MVSVAIEKDEYPEGTQREPRVERASLESTGRERLRK